MEIIEKTTRKSQTSGSSDHNDGILMNMTMKIMEIIYHRISFYIIFSSFC